ncbi:MAG TPA: nucleotide-binding protein [Pyrinomonadaceae bacterium]
MKPRILIASSIEGKEIAEALQVNLDRDMYPTVWHQAFPLSQNTIDTLLENSATHDFAAFVFSADDVLRMRNQQYQTPRDNVVVEYGFFAGMRGKDRGFIVVPRNETDLHLPSDLLGLTVADYDAVRAKTEPRAALGSAATQIKEAVTRSTWTKLKLAISAKCRSHRPSPGAKSISFPLKLRFKVTNDQRYPVVMESRSFALGSGLQFAPNAEWEKPKFLIGKDLKGKEIYAFSFIVEPSKTAIAWIGIDPAIDDVTLEAAIQSKKAGVWRYRCSWLHDAVITCDYEELF